MGSAGRRTARCVELSRDEARRGDPFADDPDPALLGVTVADVLAAARSLGTAARFGVPTTVDGPARPRQRVYPLACGTGTYGPG